MQGIGEPASGEWAKGGLKATSVAPISRPEGKSAGPSGPTSGRNSTQVAWSWRSSVISGGRRVARC
jgi:hypothetical protein